MGDKNASRPAEDTFLGDDDPELTVHATHQQLAEMLGTWRETISKTLQDFRRWGLVAPGNRQLTLLDTAGLQLEAAGQALVTRPRLLAKLGLAETTQ